MVEKNSTSAVMAGKTWPTSTAAELPQPLLSSNNSRRAPSYALKRKGVPIQAETAPDQTQQKDQRVLPDFDAGLPLMEHVTMQPISPNTTMLTNDKWNGKPQETYYSEFQEKKSGIEVEVHSLLSDECITPKGQSGVELSSADKNHIEWVQSPSTDLLDWKPRSLSYGTTVLMLAVAFLILCMVLLGISEQRTTIASSSPGIDWVFQFGPSFVAVFIHLIVARMAIDLESIYPYIAMSTAVGNQIRKSELSTLGSKSRYKGFKSPLLFAALFCSFLLVPLQSSTFQIGRPIVSESRVDVIAVDPEALPDILPTIMIPSVAVKSLWTTLGANKFRWISKKTGRGALPFYPTHGEAGPITAKTTSFGGFLACSQVYNYTFTVQPAAGKTWDVFLRLTDEDGCEFQKKINQSPLLGPVEYARGAVGNDTFALWEMASDGQTFESQSKTCNAYQQYIVTAWFDREFLENVKAETDVPTSESSGWAAMSCYGAYTYANESMSVDFGTSMLQSETSAIYSFSTHEAESIEFIHDHDVKMYRSELFDAFLKSNFLDNRAIFELPSPTLGIPFWAVLMGLPDSVDGKEVTDSFGKELMPGCQDYEVATSDNVCNLLLHIETLWVKLFAYSMPLASVFTRTDYWMEKEGSLTITEKPGWYISKSMFGLTMGLYGILILTLLSERMLSFPRWLSMRWSRGKRTPPPRTGLGFSPASIASKAFLFRNSRVRDLFTGLDTKSPKAFEEACRRKVDRSGAELQIATLRSELDPSSNAQTGVALATLQFSGSLPDSNERLPRHEEDLQKLWHKNLPWAIQPFLWVALSVVGLGTILVSFLVILPQMDQGFQLWSQPTDNAGFTSSYFLPDSLQQRLFSIIPTLILTFFSYWWSTIDTYFRQTQPFVGLHRSSPGADSVCVAYDNDMDGAIAFKAFRRRHWKLGFVTLVTFAVNIALVLAGGIFIKGTGPGRHTQSVSLQSYWREPHFIVPSHELHDDFGNEALARAMADYSNASNWEDGQYVFTIPQYSAEGSAFDVTLEGVKANLSCVETPTAFTQDPETKLWTATLSDTRCDRAVSMDICLGLEYGHGVTVWTEEGKAPIDCYQWKHLDSTNCEGDGDERWWLVGVAAHTVAHENQKEFDIASFDGYESVVCELEFFIDEVDVHVVIDTVSTEPTLSTQGVISSRKLDRQHWTMSNDSTIDLPTYFSKIFNPENFSESQGQISNGLFMDGLSLIMLTNAFNYAPGIDPPLSRIASDAISRIFCQFVTMPVGSDGGSVLLEPSPPDQHSVEIRELIIVVFANKVALLIATAIMIIYCAALVLLYPGRHRQTTVDVSTPAGALALIYDSSVATRSFDKEGNPDMHTLENTRFGYGVFQGLSGERRFGIEVAEKVEYIKPQYSWLQRLLSWTRPQERNSRQEREKLLPEENVGT